MNITIKALLLASMLMPTAVVAQQAGMSAEDRKLIVQEVIQHFRDHPEELTKPREKAPSSMVDGEAARDPATGRLSSDISVLVFSDYGCKPCVEAEYLIDAIAKSDGNIRIIHKDYPVSSEDAVAASLEIISAYNREPKQDWESLRLGIMKYGVAPEYRLAALKEAGIQATSDASISVKLALMKNREIAKQAGLKQLPAIIIMRGDKIVPMSGNLNIAKVANAIDALRQSGGG